VNPLYELSKKTLITRIGVKDSKQINRLSLESKESFTVSLLHTANLVVFKSKSSVGGRVGGGSGHVHPEDERLLPAYQVDWAVGSYRGHDAKQASTNGALVLVSGSSGSSGGGGTEGFDSVVTEVGNVDAHGWTSNSCDR